MENWKIEIIFVLQNFICLKSKDNEANNFIMKQRSLPIIISSYP